MAIPPEQLARELADLARLELADDEAATFGEQLAATLGYIRKLQEVDVSGVPEYLTAEQPHAGLRADEVGPMLESERALAGVPARRGQLIAVPKFKED